MRGPGTEKAPYPGNGSGAFPSRNWNEFGGQSAPKSGIPEGIRNKPQGQAYQIRSAAADERGEIRGSVRVPGPSGRNTYQFRGIIAHDKLRVTFPVSNYSPC